MITYDLMRYVCMIEYFNNGKVGEHKQNQEINLIAYILMRYICMIEYLNDGNTDYDTCMYNRIYHNSPTKGTNGHQVNEEEN